MRGSATVVHTVRYQRMRGVVGVVTSLDLYMQSISGTYAPLHGCMPLFQQWSISGWLAYLHCYCWIVA